MAAKLYRRSRARSILSTAIAGVVGIFSSPTRADLNWDTDAGTPGAQGGDGIWDLSTSNWYDGTNNVPWDNTGAIFGGTIGGTVTLDNGGSTISATKLIFNATSDTSLYTLTGNTAGDTLTLTGTGTNVTVNQAATISAVLDGTVGLNKAGTATLTLSGANLFTGGVAVNGGTLSISADNNLGAAANGITLAGGTLSANGTFSSARTLTLGTGGGTVGVTSGNTLTLSAALAANANALTKTDVGTLALTAGSTRTGTTLISGGKLSSTLLTGVGSGTVTVSTGATYELSAGAGTQTQPISLDGGTFSWTTSGTLTAGAGGVTLTANGGTLNPTVAGAAGKIQFTTANLLSSPAGSTLTKTGGGDVLINATNSNFLGNVAINAGFIEFQNVDALGTGTRTVTVNNGGEFVTSGVAVRHNFTLNTGATLSANSNTSGDYQGAINVAGNSNLALRFFQTQTTGNGFKISGALSGSGALNVTAPAAATLTLTGNNAAYTGAYTIGTNATVLVAGKQAMSASNAVTLSGGTLSLQDDGDGTGALQTFAQNDPVTVTANSTISVNRVGAGIGGFYTTPLNKTFQLDTLSIGANTLTVTNSNGYGLLFNGNATMTGAATFSVGTANNSNVVQGLTMSGVLSGGGTGSGVVTFTKAGAGAMVLGNSGNTFGGGGSIIDITGGYLAAGSDGAIGNSANGVRISTNSATAGFRAIGDITTSRTFTLNAANSAIEVTNGSTLTLNTAMNIATATNNLTKADNGTLVLTQAQATWDGALTITQGTVRIGNANALGTATGATTINNFGSALELNNVATSEPLTLNTSDGSITGGVQVGGSVRGVAGASGYSGVATALLTGMNAGRTIILAGVANGATMNYTGNVTLTGVPTGTSQTPVLMFSADAGATGTIGAGFTITNSTTTNVVTPGFQKIGLGTWNIAAANALTNATGTYVVLQGTLGINGLGSLGTSASTLTLSVGSTLNLDNSGTNGTNRIGTTHTVTLNGANFNLSGNSGAATTEQTGTFTVNGGQSIITLTPDATKALTLTLGASANVGRGTGGTALFRGTNLGAALNTAGAAAVVGPVAANGFAFTGQLGATATNSKSIVPWALVGNSTSSLGTSFLTADATAGTTTTGTSVIRALAGSEVATSLTSLANVDLSSTGSLSAAGLTINSLTLHSGGGVNISGDNSLLVDSGGILAFSGNTGISGGRLTTNGGSRELIVHALGNMTISSPIVTTGGFTKSGAGTLTLGSINSFTGSTSINQGKVVLTSRDSLFDNQTLLMNGGELDLNSTVQFVNNIQTQSSTRYYAGGIISNSGGSQATLAIATANVNFGGSIQGNIAVQKSQAAGAFSDWNIYAAQTYTGPTLISGGRTQLIADGALTATSSLEISRGSLLIQNQDQLSQQNNNRLNDAAPIMLRGGMLQARGKQAMPGATETFGGITLGEAINTIDLAEGGQNINSEDFFAPSLTQAAGSRASVRFRGIDGVVGNATRLFFTTAPTLNNNIIGTWAVHEREWASYTAGTGEGALNTAGYAGYATTTLATGSATDNVRLAATTGTLTPALPAASTVTVNTLALNVSGAGVNGTMDLTGKTLVLAGGGLLASLSTDTTNITISNGNITGGTAGVGGDLYVQHITQGGTSRLLAIGSNIIDNAGGAVTLILNAEQGATNTVTLSGVNTYSGGTIVNGGIIVLSTPGADGNATTAIPGNLTIYGGFANNNTTFGQNVTGTVRLGANSQIKNTATVTIKGGATLDLNGFNQTIGGLTFDNNGGDSPSVTIGAGTLTLGPTASTIQAGASSVGSVSTISATGAGVMSLNGASRTINSDAIIWNGQSVAPLQATLNIAAPIVNGSGTGIGLVKTGAGNLQLSGQSTFDGGVDVQSGGLILGASSTPGTAGLAITSSPIGLGSLRMRNNTTLLSSAAVTITNPLIIDGPNLFFNGTNNITFNGAITLPNIPTLNIDVFAAQQTVSLLGPISGGNPTINKTGLGTLILSGNTTTGPINTTGGNMSLLNDGDGTDRPEVLTYGVLTSTGALNLTVGKSATSYAPYYLNAANKTIQLAGLTMNGNQLTVTNSNGYGLEATGVSGAITLANNDQILSVVNATNSNVTQGLTLSGQVTQTGGNFTIIKQGNGALWLTNATNNFGGAGKVIDVQGGVLAFSSDGALGNSNNQLKISVSATTGAGLRATGTFGTARTIQLAAANNAIEVTAGNTLTVNSPFTIGAVGNTLTKNDNGVLELAAANAGTWTGGVTVNAGAVRISNASALGATTAAITVPGVSGAAIQLSGGISVPNPMSINSSASTNVAFGGINTGGQLESVSGVNTVTGVLTMNGDAAMGADAGSTLNINGTVNNTTTASPRAALFVGAGTINLNSNMTATTTVANQYFAINKYGSGTLNVTTANTIIFTNNFQVFGGTLSLNNAGTLTGGNTIAAQVNPGATLTVDNTASNVASRLGGRPLNLVGGNFNLIGNNGATTTESLGVSTFSRGLDTVTVTAGATQQANLVFTGAPNNVAQIQSSGPSGASVIFQGSNLGSAAGAGVATISNTSTNGFLFNGQTGATGTNTKGILPWALIATSVNGTPTTFATGDAAAAATGTTAILRPMAASEFNAANTITANTNVLLNASTATGITTATTINSATIDNANLTLGNTQLFSSSSGGWLVRTGSSTISGGVLQQTSGLSPHNFWTLGNLTIGSVMNGGNGTANGNIGVIKAGSGTLTYATPTSTIAGLTGMGVNTMSGQTVINQGTLVLNGGKNTIAPGNFLEVSLGGTLDLNGTSQQILSLFSDGNVNGINTISAGTITSTAAANLVINQDNAARNWGGVISGNVSVTRSGQNTFTIYNPQTYTGATVLNAGTTTLRDNAALANTSSIDINYGQLSLDNNAGMNDSGNRVNDAAPFMLRGGIINYVGRAQTASTETIGNVTIGDGLSQFLNAGGGTGLNSAVISAGAFSRAAGSTGVIRFQGSNGQLGSAARLSFTTINGVSTATQGGGLTNNIIGPWAIQDREWASSIPTMGIGQLNATGYAGYATTNANTAADTDNVRYTTTGTTTLLTGNRTVNTMAINLNATSIVDLGGFTLTVKGGGLIYSQSADSTTTSLTNGSVTAGTPGVGGDLFFYPLTYSVTTAGNTRLISTDVNFVDNAGGAVRLIRSGDTQAFFTMRSTGNTYTGGTVVNGAFPTFLDAAIGTPIPNAANASTGLIMSNATVTLVNRAGQIGSSNVVTLNGGAVLNLFGDNTLGGLVFNNTGGTANPTVQTFSTGVSATNTAGAANAGATGTLTLNGDITVTSQNVGTTAIIQGRMDTGAANRTISIGSIDVNGTTDVAPLQAELQLQGVVGSSGGFTKTGAGVLQLAAQESFTGPLNVTAGGIRISATQGGSRFSDLTLASGTRLDVPNLTTTVGSLGGGGTVFSSTTAGTANLTVGFNNSSTTFSGQISRFNDALPASVNLIKAGTGTMTITSAQSPTTGSTGSVTVNGGTLAYSGAGAPFPSVAAATALSSAVTFNSNVGGTLQLDNSSGNLSNRLGLNTAGTFNLQGGTLAINGSSAGNTGEVVTTFNVVNGGGIVNLAPDAASQLNMTITTLNTVNATGSALIQGIDGSAAAAGKSTLVIATPNLQASQGGGANGAANMSIRPDIIADASKTGSGTGFLVKDSVTNVYRPLATTELNQTPATWAVAQNAGIAGAAGGTAQTIALNTSANSLTAYGSNLAGSGTLSLSSSAAFPSATFGAYGPNGNPFTQTLNTGGILALKAAGQTEATALTINTSLNATAANALNIHTVDSTTSVTVAGYVGIGNTAGLVKSDAGTLNLNNTAYFTGGVAVNGGTLNLGAADNALAVVPGQTTPTVNVLAMNGVGSLVDLKGKSQVVGNLTSINPLPGMAGNVANSGAAATFTSAGSGTFAGQINGNLNFVRSGANTTLLTNTSGYTGTTTVRGGTLQLRDSGSILGTSSVALNFGTMLVDNVGLNPSSSQTGPTRVPAGVPVTLLGGTMQLNGAGSIDNTLNVGTVTVAGGQNTVTVFPYVNGGDTAKITIDNLSRSTSNHSIVNFNGFSTNNSSGINTMGGQGLTTAGNIIISHLNGAGATYSSADLQNNLIGGWAVADGSAFATYVNGQGVIAMGNTVAGIVAPGFDGTDVTAATTSSQNINDGTTPRTVTGAHAANSWRFAPGATQTITLATATPVTLGAGIITNANFGITIVGTDATSTLTSAGSDLYVYINQNTTNINTKITGSMALVKGGGATLGLAPVGASNDYTGGTFVQSGTMTLNAAAGLVAIPGDLTINNATVTMSTNAGQIASAANIMINGGGVLNMTGSNTLNSVTFNNAGGTVNPTVATSTSLTLSAANAISSTNDTFSTTPVISGTALVLSSATPTITTSGLSVNDLNVTAVITSAGGAIAKEGAGSLTLTGANTFTTGVNLNNGSLIFGASSTPTTGTVTSGPLGTGSLTIGSGTAILSDGTARTLANGVTVAGDFTFGGVTSGNGVTLSGPVTLGASGRTITVTSPAVTDTISGALTSTATSGNALTKAGSGILVLSSATNNFNGMGVSVTDGVLRNGVANAIPNGSPISVAAKSVYDLNGFGQISLSIAGDGVITNGGAAATYVIGGTSATDITANVSSLFSGAVSNGANALNLTKSGLGTLTLSGTANSYTGVTNIAAGTLSVAKLSIGGQPSSIGQSTNVPANLLVGSATGVGTLQYTGTGDTTDRQMTIGVAGATLDASGTGPVNFTATAMTMTAGVARTLTLTGSNTANNTLAAVIANSTGNVSLSKTGAGTWVLTGASTYAGGTTITSGSLLANNASGSATGTAAVNLNGGKFGGFGSISGALTINGGAASPGDPSSLATQTRILKVASVSMPGGANATVAIEAQGQSGAGTNYDQLQVTATTAGALDVTNASLTFAGINGFVSDGVTPMYILANTGSTGTTNPVAGRFATINGLPLTNPSNDGLTYVADDGNGGQYKLLYNVNFETTDPTVGNGNDIALVTNVPEPGTVGLLAAGAVAGLLTRRRRRRN